MTLEWKERRPSAGPVSYHGYSGTVRVFSIHWTCSRDSDWVLQGHLPGIEDKDLGDGSVEQMQALAEDVFSAWLAAAGLKKANATEGGGKE